MEIEKLKELLGFAKFFLGTFILGAATFLVNRDIQNREIEIKEQEQIAKYIEHAIQDDVGIRLRFAQYFKHVTRSDVLRTRWSEYLTIVQAEYDTKEAEKEKLVAQAQLDSISGQEKEALQVRIEEYNAALNPSASKKVSLLPSRIYLHVRSREQKSQVAGIATLLSNGGFYLAGTQVLSSGPDTTELRYFREREREYAQAALDLIKDTVEITLTYVPGYENSKAIRDRHFEVWFSENAFE